MKETDHGDDGGCGGDAVSVKGRIWGKRNVTRENWEVVYWLNWIGTRRS